MRYPEFLKENGTIGFVAPSFGAATEPFRSAFDNALKKFHALGYRTKLGPNCYASDGVGISSTPENCGKEINEAVTSPDSDVLISCGGGELMCEILDFVDFDRIAQASPKWYMGYSDNTNLTFLLPTLCDTAAIYGPCAGTFGMEPMAPFRSGRTGSSARGKTESSRALISGKRKALRRRIIRWFPIIPRSRWC